jgi:hypothetical protein
LFSRGNRPLSRAFPVDSREFPRLPSPSSWWQFAAICGELDRRAAKSTAPGTAPKVLCLGTTVGTSKMPNTTSPPAGLLMANPDVKRRILSRQSVASPGPMNCGLFRPKNAKGASGTNRLN